MTATATAPKTAAKKATSKKPTGPVTAAEVREWAANKGIEVGSRGTLPKKVIDAFNKGRKRQYGVGVTA